ncbi:hypothetical protein [Nostoc sp.]|uniref:hypothetical protein n=1 Tax=Nostoc sp. TaxID=1180 RepID=UPI002FF4EEC1
MVSRLEATVVGSDDLYPFGEASYAQRLPLGEATGVQKLKSFYFGLSGCNEIVGLFLPRCTNYRFLKLLYRLSVSQSKICLEKF